MNRRSSILVIDDDPTSTTALCNMLSSVGYRVEAANNGNDGLRLALSGKFRIVITDWMMPELAGTDLCHKIRCAELPHYTYILMLSQRSRVSDIVEGLGAGADDYVTKPVAESELMARLRTAERMLSLITRDVTIFALAKLAESRDTDTGAHLERVRHYSRALASYLRFQPGFSDQIDDEFIQLIFLTSPLHDIGKVGIPDAILLKPDRLTPEEFDYMKRHTTIGADTLEAALKAHPEALYLQMARDIALTHHERYDGAGYPLGLSGAHIPVAGRIVALADVYDALTSRRVYKLAYSADTARSLITDQRGKQFDPTIVDAFLALEPEFDSIRRQFADEHHEFMPGPGPFLHAA